MWMAAVRTSRTAQRQAKRDDASSKAGAGAGGEVRARGRARSRRAREVGGDARLDDGGQRRVERARAVPERVRVAVDERREPRERAVDVRVLDRVDEDARADGPGQRRAQQPVAVHRDLAHCALVRLGGDAAHGARQAERGVRAQHALRLRAREQAELLGEQRREGAVNGDRLAVAQLERLRRLERARERVAEVHRADERLLPQVGADALQHRVHRARDRLVRLRRAVVELVRDEACAVRLEQLEQRAVVHQR
eukprot:CAMPEP_0119429382 /NCGR_PEP_ID=MMETSP1335-20130426/42106_1 /TAXON_ID=259385 /ORGANISM="Chrysoculter rhomboideus, Strain RCC1486" /LENGTH=252 /DNA_ID=CAMNT_0007455099 /DNA_START=174 /DNA_END=929 /DNA_ORIENTATION=+